MKRMLGIAAIVAASLLGTPTLAQQDQFRHQLHPYPTQPAVMPAQPAAAYHQATAPSASIRASGTWTDILGTHPLTVDLPNGPDGPVTITAHATPAWPCGTQIQATGTKSGGRYTATAQTPSSCGYVNFNLRLSGNRVTGTIDYSGYRGGSDVNLTVVP